ncbi:MAG: T9SS type A sorting domain-containing protein, partial [Bacteroidales bacterium]|nr:T9SS type A sorting domain-containing protein [Bacteroidales bacterium]
ANNILCGLYGICRENYELRITNYELEESKNSSPFMEGWQPKADGVVNQSSSAQSELPEFKKALANIKIFPNPGKDQITVISEIGNCNFELIDMLGIIQKTVILQKGYNTLNISSLVRGIYFYKVFYNNIIETGKWIKE